MPVFNNALAGAAGSAGGADAYEIKRSLRFNGGDSANLSRSPSITNGTTSAHSHWTFSAWVKRTKLGVTNQPIFGAMNGSNREGFIAFNADDTLRFSETGPSSSSYHVDLHTSQKFRDLNAWYHIVVVYAYNQYSFDKARIYVNGIEVTQYGTKTLGGGLYDSSYINTNGANHYIGKYLDYSSNATYGDMYLANVHFVPGYTVPVSTDDDDGSVTGIPNAKYLTEFGEFSSDTGVWIPKEYEGTYPRDGGFHLEFSDNSSNAALGTDSSGNSNTWTVNNLSVASGSGNDSLIDSPTNYQASSGNNGGNYAVLNPLSMRTGTLSNGNLRFVASPDSSRNESTIAVTSGKYYWEAEAITNMQTHTIGGRIGICQSSTSNPSSAEQVEFDVDWHANAGIKIRRAGQSSVSAGSGTNYDNGDLIGVALDADNNIVKFYKNGTLAYTVDFSQYITPGSVPLVAHSWGYFSSTWEYNFGQRPFSQTVPTGYKSLCTQNLPDSLIDNGSNYFEAKTYSGTGSTQSITGLEFKPDLTWIKPRNASDHHILYDSVRGVRKQLYSNGPTAEETETQGLSAFTSDGFTVNGAHTVRGQTNDSGKTYISWNWDAGDAANPTSISVGGLNSSVYDQSQTWSTNSTMSSAAGAFDGSAVGSSGNAIYSNTGNVLTSSSLTINSKLEIYTNRPHTGAQNGTKITINGTDYYDKPLASTGWSEVDLSGATLPLTTTGNILIEDEGGNASGLWSVRVDGKRLVDSNVTPPNVPSIATTVRANPSAGFSVITWTGNETSGGSIAHGLSTPPKLLLIKDTDNAYNWYVVTTATGSNIRIEGLNNTNGGGSTAEYTTDSSVISNLSQYASLNTSGATMLIYAFSPVEGYSAIGSYESNGLNNGPFVYTGFRPRWLLIRHSGSGQDWIIIDTARDPNNNGHTQKLTANEVNTEVTQTLFLDILSNGFKLRSNAGAVNDGNDPYFYLAIAENPFKHARAF